MIFRNITCKNYIVLRGLCSSAVQIKVFLSHLYDLNLFTIKCDTLRDLVPFVQFKKREKHPWRSVTFSNVAG